MAMWEVPSIRRQWRYLTDANFPTFLAAARRGMPAEEFALAERYYWHAFERTEAWLDNHLPDQGRVVKGSSKINTSVCESGHDDVLWPFLRMPRRR
jgi:hypothetical protein